MPKKGYCGGSLPLSVSQNFLTAHATLRRVVQRCDLSPVDHVIEIGTGKGHLTAQLLKTGAHVTSCELDPQLAARAAEKFANEPRLTLVQGDFLKLRLPPDDYYLIGNIPFAITTAIFDKAATAPAPPRCMVFVMEKGAAHRFLGQPHLTAAALRLLPWYEGRIVYHFRREDFHPAPRVDCVLLRMDRRETPDLPLSERTAWRSFVAQASATSLHRLLSAREIAAAFRHEHLPPPLPGRDILYIQWLCLFRWWRSTHRRK